MESSRFLALIVLDVDVILATVSPELHDPAPGHHWPSVVLQACSMRLPTIIMELHVYGSGLGGLCQTSSVQKVQVA